MIAEWKSTILGNEIQLAYGKSLPSQNRLTGKYNVYGSNGKVGTHTDFLIEGPGIVIGRKGSVGEVVFAEENFWPIDTTYYVNNKNHDWKFLFYFLQTLGMKELNSHSTIPGLNREDVYKMEVSLPPSAEQKAIATALNYATSGINYHDKAEKKSQELKRSAMHELFTRGLRGEAQKETEIGLVPESWNILSIKEICHIFSGGTPRKSIPEYWNGEIPWASGKDLKTPTLQDTIDHVSREGVDAGSRIAPADAVLILVRGMGLAKDLPIAVALKPMAFNQDLKALVSRNALPGIFLRSAIYNAKNRLLSRMVPSAHGTMTLNLDDLETLLIGVPTDPAEAEEIKFIINAIDRKIDLHKRKKAVLEELFKSLLHKLMTGEIRVADLDLSAIKHPEAA